jgi:hypothetical protein
MSDRENRSIRAALISKVNIEDSGIMSADNIIERLAIARNTTTKQSNRLLMLSLAFSLFFLIKIAGLRIDIVLADQKIFELPYGLFIFCIVSQISYSLSLIISFESRVFDRMIRGICDKKWPDTSELVYRTFPNEGLWFDTTSHAVRKLDGAYGTKTLFWLASFIALAIATTIFLMPLILGVYFLCNSTDFIKSGHKEIQYYSVAISTTVCALWTIFGISIFLIDEDDLNSIGG